LGLAWGILDSPSFRQPIWIFLLSLVLVLQILPGHFQLAFITQVMLLLMVGWNALERRSGSKSSPAPGPDRSRRDALVCGLLVAGCVAIAFPLAALQVWPTARLAGLASSQRGFRYLSEFATTPLHLVSYVAPGLFHRSSMWRPLVWDPFHTSPEEMLAYIGLAPLLLAILAIWHDFRRFRMVRVLSILAGVSLLLSLGPYVPGFRGLIALPGFSFFRAPARWSVATSLVLAILAGRGLDRCGSWPQLGRSLAALSVASACWILLVLGLIELALAGGSRGASGAVTGLFQTVFRARPWEGDPDFRAVLAQAQKPASDARIPSQLVHARIALAPRDPRSFVQCRREIYTRELAGTACLLAAMMGLALAASFQRTRRWLPAALVFLTLLDLGLLGRHRLVSVGPLRPLTEQSPVLARLAQEPAGTRVADGFRNLSMRVGLEPISSYRTLDLPALEPITSLARGPLQQPRFLPLVRKALRATGVGVRVLDPVEVASEPLASRSNAALPVPATIDDPELARWLFGDSWLDEQGAWGSKFQVIRPEGEQRRAWFVPLTAVDRSDLLDTWNGEIEPVLGLFDKATPLTVESRDALRWEIAVDAPGAGWVLVTQLADPQWRARWTDEEWPGSLEGEILPTFRRRRGDGGWQRVRVPAPGRWTLRLDYDAADVRHGLAISGAAWLAWGIVLVLWQVRRGRGRPSG
jgi:hypothetical protein